MRKGIKIAIVLLLALPIIAAMDELPVWEWGKNNEGFRSEVVIYKQPNGFVAFEEYTSPHPRMKVKEEMSLPNDFSILFTWQAHLIRFIKCERIDPWWTVSYALQKNGLVLKISGKWNPAKDGVDAYGSSGLYRIFIEPITNTWSEIQYQVVIPSEREEYKIRSFIIPPMTQANSSWAVTSRNKLTTTWGRVKNAH